MSAPKIGLAVLLAVLVVLLFQTSKAGPDGPNILLIVTDEHNFRTLGCYREQMSPEQAEMWGAGCVVETPHMDRLANEGLICTKAYATSPVCSPCRASMFTGLYPQNTGVRTNDEELRGDVPTIAKIASGNGYRTTYIGKWHLGGTGRPEWAPRIDGGFESKQYMYNRGHWKKFELTTDGARVGARDKKGRPSDSVDGAGPETFATDFLTDRAIEFVTEGSTKPFLAVLSYPDPHGPNTVRAPYDQMYDHLPFEEPRTYGREDIPPPRWLGRGPNHAKFRGDEMSRYFGMVKCIDDNIGRLLAALEDSGKLDSTIIMLTSDHGDMCYEHDIINKGRPYEGSARIPMLIRYPGGKNAGGGIPAGAVYRQPVGAVDVTPTLLALAGATTEAAFQGRDLSAHWGNAGQGTDSLGMTFLRNSGKTARWLAAIDERYKLVLAVNAQPWLFDLEEDPDEFRNYFGRPETKDVTERLAAALIDYAEANDEPHVGNPRIARSLERCLSE